jgi:hypothetical protein
MAVLMNTFWVLTNAYLGIFAFMNVAKRQLKRLNQWILSENVFDNK